MRILLAIAVALAFALPAGADACVPTTSSPEVSTCWPIEVRTLSHGCDYIDSDLCQPSCLWRIWWYTESNGIEGLQRDDSARDDTCGGLILSDDLFY